MMIQKLMLQLAAHRRHRFGKRSEGLDQFDLDLDDIEPDQAAATTARDDVVADMPGADGEGLKQKPKRRPLPAHLPRDCQTFAPASTDCPCCGEPMRKMAEDAREVLDYLPASFIVRRQVIEKFSCRDCGKVVEGEPPDNPIAKGAAGPGLLAHVLVSKYADALPLYRQSAIYARQDIDLARSTMAGWVSKMADLLAPCAARKKPAVIVADRRCAISAAAHETIQCMNLGRIAMMRAAPVSDRPAFKPPAFSAGG